MNRVNRWVECEDWVEVHTDKQLSNTGKGRYETLVNFGGPGARTPYHFYIRVKAGNEDCIENISVDREEFIHDRKIISIPGTPAEYRWVYLGHVKSRRDYRLVTIYAPEGLAGLERLCVLQIPQRLESGEIDRRIAWEVKETEPLSGVPLGGAGTGKLEFCRDGLFRNITINGNIDTPVWRSDSSFFAIRTENEGRTMGRIISSRPLHGLAPMEKIEFEGLYPTALLKSEDRDFPLTAEIHATGAVIPENIKDSSLPAALFRVRLASKCEKKIRVTLAFSMENFLGCGGALVETKENRVTWDEGYYEVWQERYGNTESPWKSDTASGLLFDAGKKEEVRSEGQYVLVTDLKISSFAGGCRSGDMKVLWQNFVDTGRLACAAGKPSEGEITSGAITVDIEMKPGEVRDINFVFSWYVPCFRQVGKQDYGHYYMNHFSSALEIAEYVLKNFKVLETASRQVPELLQNSTLPKWLVKTLCNDAYIFSTGTWLTKDGRFSVNEGPTHMFGCMGTLDQKLYANHYYSLFFPELDRNELLGFVRSQSENGSIQHDLGYGHIEQKGRGTGWPDLSSALVILSLKHYQLTGDESYIKEAYPHLIRCLLDFQMSMDKDDDGIANISGVGNTFDAEKFEGTSSYIATLWLAALKALENLAVRFNDTNTAERCRKAFDKARTNAIKQLWNGRYFVNYFDNIKGKGSANSHVSQVAGEFFARLCGLGPLYGDEYVREALISILSLNYHPRFIFPSNEATPEGKMPVRTMWGWLPHVRVFLGGIPLYFGLEEDGIEALERMDRVITECNDDNRWDLRLFYEPDTGRQHWGRFYMSAPSTWYIYQALLGYRWDKPEGLLEIIPNLPESFLPFSGPLFLPGFWAWLEIDKKSEYMRMKILKRFDDEIRIKKLQLPCRKGTLSVSADGSLLEVKHLESCLGGESYSCNIDISTVQELLMERK